MRRCSSTILAITGVLVTAGAAPLPSLRAQALPRLLAEVADPANIRVDHAWSRASAGPASTGVAYFTVTNDGPPDRLVGTSTPIAATAELHETIRDNGVMKMRPVGALALTPGKPLTLSPGGYHVMLTGLKAPLKPNADFPLTLTFEHAPPITVTVKVEAVGAQSHMDHMP
jgi:periplasmic copper chaperone A